MSKRQKKELVKSLKKLIKRVKKSEIKDLEVEVNQNCPLYGEYADNCGVIHAVPGNVIRTDINIKYITRRNP